MPEAAGEIAAEAACTDAAALPVGLPAPPGYAAASRRPRLRLLLGLLQPYRFATLSIVAMALVLAALGSCEPLVLKLLFDNFHPGGTVSTIGFAMALLVALTIARDGVSAFSNWLTWRTRIGVQYALLQAAVDRLHRLPVSFHQAEGVGATMTRLDRGIQGLVAASSEIAIQALPALVYLILSSVLMFRLEPRLAIVVLLFAPLPALLAGAAAPVQTRRERQLMDCWTRIYSRFHEVLTGIVTVKSFAMEDVEKRRFLDRVGEANAVVVRGVGFDSMVGVAQNTATAAARLCAIGYGGHLALAGEITVGTLVAFLGYLGGVFAPVQGLSGLYRTFRTASVSFDTLFEILGADDPVADRPDAREAGPFAGEVEFANVSFAYEARGRLVLCGIDLRVAPGEVVAFVGPSGSGKSTLMGLLQRFHDPVEGAVRIDGTDIREFAQRSLRRQIGVVLQDTLLFHDSIRTNIAYGRPDATMEEIVAAARAAGAHEFIVALPDGYDTLVGERGSRLSTGERQRIAIARVFLKDPAILIFDEPTSALDAESEAVVQESIEKVIRRRTTFLIAHRLSTVVRADRIVVLDGGRIVEQGTHAGLLREGGAYASLVRRQSRGLLPDSAASWHGVAIDHDDRDVAGAKV